MTELSRRKGLLAGEVLGAFRAWGQCRTGADPQWAWDEKAVRQYVMCTRTRGYETKTEVPTTNRPE